MSKSMELSKEHPPPSLHYQLDMCSYNLSRCPDCCPDSRSYNLDKQRKLRFKCSKERKKGEHSLKNDKRAEEKQNMLNSTIRDMENVIKDLKQKVAKAERRADSVEDKYASLNEEVSFLTGRLKRMEAALHEAEEAKSQNQNEKQEKQIHYRKKIEEMTRIEATPRTNDGIRDPTEAELKLGLQSLSDYMQSFGMVERIIMGDGNCQYRALSDQLYGTEEKYDLVKRAVIEQLKKEPDDYRGYVPVQKFPTFDHYVDYISRDKVWGDYITLSAAAEALKITINLFSTLHRDKVVTFTPKSPKDSTKDCYISFWGQHYNSVYYKFD